jgi:hypothetical protein
MKAKTFSKNAILFLSLLLLASCGGGGSDNAPATTSVTGATTPPATPEVGVNYATADMLVAPNSAGTWSNITQTMKYFFDYSAASAGLLKVNSLMLYETSTHSTNYTSITTGAAFASDATLGQPVASTHSSGVGAWGTNATSSTVGTLAGFPSATFSQSGTVWTTNYVLPYSASLNPAGYTYQTFGVSLYYMASFFSEVFYSCGVVTDPATLPTSGTATYTGKATASMVDTASREPYDAISTVNISIDFATRSVSVSTTGTTSVSSNASVSTPYSSTPALNLSGTLTYSAGSNTFTGVVTSTNGMSGNVTGRLYGPGIASATASKVAGAPPEIGGTFALMQAGGNVMQGSFGGN